MEWETCITSDEITGTDTMKYDEITRWLDALIVEMDYLNITEKWAP